MQKACRNHIRQLLNSHWLPFVLGDALLFTGPYCGRPLLWTIVIVDEPQRSKPQRSQTPRLVSSAGTMVLLSFSILMVVVAGADYYCLVWVTTIGTFIAEARCLDDGCAVCRYYGESLRGLY